MPNFPPAASQSLSSRTHRRSTRRRLTSRRSGVALIYATLGLSTFLGITALVVDMGNLYTKRAQAQRAADAAALAGAYELPNGAAAAERVAREYALSNGYSSAKNPSEVPMVTISGGSDAQTRQVRVRVERPEPLYFLPAFAALLGESASSSRVGAQATALAQYQTNPVDIDISGGREYGTISGSTGTTTGGTAEGGFANPSVFGRDSRFEYGDPYTPKFLNDGVTPNTNANDPHGADANFKGYEYKINIAPNYQSLNAGSSEVQLEIFDPDSYGANGIADWDEMHYGDAGQPDIRTVTRYSLYAPNGELVAEASYGPDQSTNLKWTTPAGFKFDSARFGSGAYRLLVKGIEGSDENGFQLRAGRPHEGLTSGSIEDDAAWKTGYNNGGAGNGTGITATGKTVINFTRDGTVKIKLGFIPGEAASGNVFIDKFDTDVGAKSIVYNCDAPGFEGRTWPGTLSSNGAWGVPTDSIPIPADYPPTGGNWYATYVAAAYDTSTWTMNYAVPGRAVGGTTDPGSGRTNSTTGVIRLVE